DELFVAAVGGEGEAIVNENGRAAVAMDGRIAQVAVAPDHFAVEIDTGGPLMAEVDVDAFAIGDRRWAGVAVLLVDLGRLGRALLEDVGGPELLAVGGVERDQLQRQVLA